MMIFLPIENVGRKKKIGFNKGRSGGAQSTPESDGSHTGDWFYRFRNAKLNNETAILLYTKTGQFVAHPLLQRAAIITEQFP